MLRPSLIGYFFIGVFLCLGVANLPAQDPEMRPPPIPDVFPPPPPDPNTLPPPPPQVWEPLVPRGSAGQPVPVAAAAVPEPQSESLIAPPPPPVIEVPLPGEPDPAQMELAKPDVQIWRPAVSVSPQIPARRFNRLNQAYITGTDPVVLRVQFDPLAAGKTVYVKPGRGITLNPFVVGLTVSASGECIVSAQLAEGLARSHIIFYCEGVKTVLPLVRASLQRVEAEEALTGGG